MGEYAIAGLLSGSGIELSENPRTAQQRSPRAPSGFVFRVRTLPHPVGQNEGKQDVELGRPEQLLQHDFLQLDQGVFVGLINGEAKVDFAC